MGRNDARPARLGPDGIGWAGAASARTVRGIAELAGSATAASWLGVPRSRLARWCHGDEQPTFRDALALLDLDIVLTRAPLVWQPRVAIDWMTSSNAFLDGARPIDILNLHGTTEVIHALDAVAVGAYV